LKKVYYEYNLDAAYLSRRIIGLPSLTEAWGRNQETAALEKVSKITYGYDTENFNQEANQNIASAIQRDNANFGVGFIVGRGNLTSVSRHDVTGATPAVTTKTRYDIAGSVVARLDPLNRKTRIEYDDKFNDGINNRNTFAYPTKIFDAADNFSEAKYRFDTGANVWAKSPAPHGNAHGKETTRIFDNLGRLVRESIYKQIDDEPTEYAYTRYEYFDNGRQSRAFATVTDANANGVGDAADEAMSETWTDGAGRVLRSRQPHTFSTNGSVTTWAGSLVEYDLLGQVKRSSVPTEIAVNESTNIWTPSGDDAVRGWLWKYQKYDWRGRVTRIINTDGADSPTLNDSDQLFSYEGCGCAGGQVTIVQGELVPRDDLPTQNARRTQKIYEDILGRVYKTEVYNWDGASVYTTIVNTYNGRDQAVKSRQYAGADTSATFQDTTAAFDGHGRLKTAHRPEQQNANGTPAVTTYNYNADDAVESVTDARGAATNYAYNDPRGLLTQISYEPPDPNPTNISAAPTVNFTYDNLGNRTGRTTFGVETKTYAYNSLSQLISETQTFTDLPNNGYQIQYSYHLGGQLKTLTEPFGVEVNYNLDKSGKLLSVTPTTAYGATTTAFASNAKYRAFGALKHLEYGSGMQMNQTFNNRLQAASYLLGDAQTQVMNKTYDYYADGNLRSVADHLNWRFHRLNRYDQMGRIKEAKSSVEAQGQTIPDGYEQTQNLPYRQSYQFNAFGDLTERYNKQWGGDIYLTTGYNFTNRRITDPGWQYDADGRATASLEPVGRNAAIKYDAAGQMVHKHDYTALTVYEDKLDRYYDGDGREVKRVDTKCRIDEGIEPPPTECAWSEGDGGYYVRSSVLGGEVISELSPGGTKKVSYVRVGASILAHLRQNYVWQPGGGYYYDAAYYEHADSSGFGFRMTKRLMPAGYFDYSDERQAEFDAGGTNVGLVSSYQLQYDATNSNVLPLESESALYVDGRRVTATLDGVAINWQAAQNLINSGWIGGTLGLTEILMRQSDARFTNIRVRLSDGGRWHNFGNNFEAAYGFADFNGGGEIRAHLNFGFSAPNLLGILQIKGIPEIWASEAPDRKMLSVVDLAVLKKKVKELLTKECTDFIKALIDRTKEILATDRSEADANTRRYLEAPRTRHFTNIISLFDSVVAQGGFYGSVRANLSTVTGNIENRTATVYLAQFRGWTTTTNTPDSNMTKAELARTYDYHMSWQAMFALHELLHFNYGDVALARAAATLNNDINARFSYKDTTQASLYWHDKLNKHCGQTYSFNRR
jgi:YD repeat-containing protein